MIAEWWWFSGGRPSGYGSTGILVGGTAVGERESAGYGESGILVGGLAVGERESAGYGSTGVLFSGLVVGERDSAGWGATGVLFGGVAFGNMSDRVYLELGVFRTLIVGLGVTREIKVGVER